MLKCSKGKASYHLARLLAHSHEFRIPFGSRKGALAYKADFASSATDDRPSIKKHLHELYKRVHPDKFHAQPFAREANEKSFKLLQEYLAEAKEGGSFGSIAGVPYRLVFYLHQKPEAEEYQTIPMASKQDGLYKVGVTLPPPGRLLGLGYTDSEYLPLGARKAIGSLLAACGLPNEFKDEEEEFRAAFSGCQALTGERLRDFMPKAANMMHQNESVHFGPLEHLRMAQTVLRMGRQVTAEFSAIARRRGTAEKAGMLEQLARCLDRQPAEIGNIHFLLCDRYGLDSLGQVQLQFADDTEAWSGYLAQLDLKACRERQAKVAETRALERSVALRLGLPLIFTRSRLTLSTPYSQFLKRISRHSEEWGPIFDPVPADLSLLVEEASNAVGPEHPSNEDFLGACHLSEDDGMFIVPANAAAEVVYSICQKHGGRLQSLLNQRKARAAELDVLRHQTERRLRLRKLLLDPSVPAQQLRACCIRLVQASDTVRKLFDGLSVRISHVNQVSPHGSCIDIAWNFEI